MGTDINKKNGFENKNRLIEFAQWFANEYGWNIDKSWVDTLTLQATVRVFSHGDSVVVDEKVKELGGILIENEINDDN